MTTDNFTDPIDQIAPLSPPPARQAPEPPSATPPVAPPPAQVQAEVVSSLPDFTDGRPNFKFTAGEGTTGDRVKALEAFVERVAPYLELVYLAYENIQREQQKSTELWTYVCKGPDPSKPDKTCNMQMRAKRPEFRTWQERLICPNPIHNGELTPMEPILPQ